MRATNAQAQPWWETTEFDFIRIPKELYRNPYYGALSPESKLLYGFLLDRACLSRKMGEKWHNEQGQPFVIFTLAEIQARMGCADKKATRTLRSLAEHRLIRISRPKKDGPYHIQVLPFQRPEEGSPGFQKKTCPGFENTPAQSSKERLPSRQKNDCPVVETTIAHSSKQRLNNTDNNKTDRNNTDTIRETWVCEVKKNIDYDILCMDQPRDRLDAIVEVMADTLASADQTVRISGQIRPMEEVRKRLLEADMFRIQYILHHMQQNTGPVQSYRAYFLARLWEPEGIVDAFYDAWVRRDMAKDRRRF